MVMGKGGVGKTTIAAAVAAELASRGHHVHLSTTDPAAHVAATLAGSVENLTVSRIDPAAETKAYVDRVMATRGAKLDDAGRALLAEDLRSPCYEEVAVFAAFSRIVSQARSSFVVLDTAPTGHTLLLLDATGSYHRQIVRRGRGRATQPARIVTPLMRLRDPELHEDPARDARRDDAGLRSGAAPGRSSPRGDRAVRLGHQQQPRGRGLERSVSEAAHRAELEQIELVRARHANKVAIVPWVPDEPVGPERLLALAGRRVDS